MKLVILLINSCFSLKVYHSIPKNKGTTGEESGFRYSEQQNLNIGQITKNDLTFCIRFNYKTLDDILLFKFKPKISGSKFTYLHIVYPKSFFGLGLTNDDGKSVSSSWILKNPITNDFNIWFAFKWHHFCFAYESTKSRISVVKVIIKTVIMIQSSKNELQNFVICKMS